MIVEVWCVKEKNHRGRPRLENKSDKYNKRPSKRLLIMCIGGMKRKADNRVKDGCKPIYGLTITSIYRDIRICEYIQSRAKGC